jgi:NAD(P)-dependent dehydrogenase (short-subunit alcohol dehydrogenase family)
MLGERSAYCEHFHEQEQPVTLDLAGKNILVTGASGGIGAATAALLGERGACVVAHYASNQAGAQEAIAHLPEGRGLVLQADLSTATAARALWRESVAWRGRIDVLVNNAAVMPWSDVDGSDEDWDAAWATVLAVNVAAPAALLREAVRHFTAEGGGVVVTLSSWVAQQGSGHRDLVAYAASKAAMKAATQTVARARARDGVLAYVIAPGVVDTDLSRRAAATSDTGRGLTMGEWVPPQEIAETVAFLASGRVRHLSGATLDVNGASYVR